MVRSGHLATMALRFYLDVLPYRSSKQPVRRSNGTSFTRDRAIKLTLSIQFHLSLGRCSAATRQRPRSWARVRRERTMPPRMPRSQRNGRSGRARQPSRQPEFFTHATPAAAQKAAAAHVQRQADLGTLRDERRANDEQRAKHMGLQGKHSALKAKAQANTRGLHAFNTSSRPCMLRAQLVHAGRRPPCVRRAGAVHALTHALTHANAV
jgi:hypothetical protein